MGLLHRLNEAAIEQVQAEAYINNRSNNCGVFDLLADAVRMVAQFAGKIVSTVRIVFPKVDAMA